jgi:hypothetical protein
MKSWTMVLNLHENLNALFNIISFQDVLEKLHMWYIEGKKKHEFQKQLQKPKSTKSYGLWMTIFGLYFQNSIYILVKFCWINFIFLICM